ncbi:hypothetical protein Tco_0994722 [Tanacetum coccineum]
MGDVHLSIIPETESDEVTKSSVEDLVPIPSESKGISNDTCNVPFCDNSLPLDVLNDHFEIFFDFNNDCTLSDDDSFEDIDYVEASPPDSELISLEEVKEDILHEKLLNINLLIACDLPSSDDFSPINTSLLMPNLDLLTLCLVEICRSHLLRLIFFPRSSPDEILREKLLNVNLLIDKIEALNLTPSIPFVLKYPSSSYIPVVDSDFLIEEVDTFLVPEDSILPGIESDFDSEGDIIFLNDLLNDDPIPEY